MIIYENGLKTLFQASGSVVMRSFPFAFVGAMIALVFKLLPDLFSKVFGQPYAHQVFSMAVGFMLVFRASLSYQRFWEGRSSISTLSSRLGDAVMQVIAYDRVVAPDHPAADGTVEFLRSQAHLFSFMHALALQALRGDEEMLNLVEPFRREEPNAEGNVQALVVLGGVSQAERDALADVKNRVVVVMGWIERDILIRHKSGGMSVAPPILARVLTAVGDGFFAWRTAMKIRDTPFPFPYAQMMNLVIILFSITTPLAIAAFTNDTTLAVLLAFITVATVISLENVAKEIEDPYGFDANDLPLSWYHDEYD